MNPIFHHLHNHFNTHDFSRPFIIGITGVGGSGKTQFALALAEYLRTLKYDVAVVHLDDFHNPRAIRYQDPNEIMSYINHAFDLKLIEKEILRPVHQGEDIQRELLLLDLETDTFINRKQYVIGKQAIVIIEGVLLFREPIDIYLDCRIFLDVTLDEILRRVAERDIKRFGEEIIEKYKKKYIPIDEWFIAEYKPKERSDFVIENSDYHQPRILAHLY